MATEVRVDPALLEAKAGTAAELHAGLDRELTDVEPETAQAARELHGWQTGTALENLLHWWQDDLGKLRQHLDALAEGLRLCARDYRHSDLASADNFRNLGR
ncbi:WXG100 family type VII secretion target [Plantactinospora sp. WMMB782]|uniref:WXG100 family type VII secretion target n=1 Tax=Plantactinospora sp. WMMB782 TaxID=3404121 RepID=UPI003B9604EA